MNSENCEELKNFSADSLFLIISGLFENASDNFSNYLLLNSSILMMSYIYANKINGKTIDLTIADIGCYYLYYQLAKIISSNNKT